ncbi:NADH-quinone oxidoreductase subunit C [Streptomyces sp. NPDC101160]|uniref:NADH-quinone oxidoreductase subunit C n=1 Tax=Streptomyces sp. NPDC101160 TaxID=3366118 RepID=UPI0038250E67
MSDTFADGYAALPDSVTELFGEEATAERAYDLLTVDVPTASWIAALEIARDKLGLTYFDWLSAVDEPGVGFRVCAHVASVGAAGVRRLLLRTTVPHASPSLPSAIAVYAGAAWHERETYEMFGVTFTDHPHLVHLLLPENFEGHPLRKDFVLAARVAKAWPGAKEPGESHDPAAPKRRQMLPPGVPDPNDWGPLKGQLPPAPSRPTRAAAADRPARRTRTAGEGSASQTDAPPARGSRTATAGSASQRPEAPAGADETPAVAADGATPPAGPRRARSASGGSASQRPEAAPAEAAPGHGPAPAAPAPGTDPDAAAPTPPAGPRRARSASGGSASQRPEAAPAEAAPGPGPAPAGPAGSVPPAGAETPGPPAGPRRNRSASAGSASQRTEATGAPDATKQRPAPARSADAPWHHARPAFDEEPKTGAPQAPPAEGGTAADDAAGRPAQGETPGAKAEAAKPAGAGSSAGPAEGGAPADEAAGKAEAPAPEAPPAEGSAEASAADADGPDQAPPSPSADAATPETPTPQPPTTDPDGGDSA